MMALHPGFIHPELMKVARGQGTYGADCHCRPLRLHVLHLLQPLLVEKLFHVLVQVVVFFRSSSLPDDIRRGDRSRDCTSCSWRIRTSSLETLAGA